MMLLALDSSGPSAGLALLRDGQLVYEATVTNKLTHSVNLMPMVEEGLVRSGMTPADIDVFAAVVGPGSFTGVRIAVAAVQGMAQAQNKQCIAVDALEALAFGLLISDVLICPIRDARVNQVYGAAFYRGKRLMEDAAMKLEDYLHLVRNFDGQLCFVGDGVTAYQEEIINSLGAKAVFAPPHLLGLKPGAAAFIAANQLDCAVSPKELLPLYLRQPQAVRERQKHHG